MKETLWEPSEVRKQQANMSRFIKFINAKYDKDLVSFDQLYDWSIREATAFWEAMWEFGSIKAACSYEQVVINFDDMLKAHWFVGAKFNFAENLLRYRDDRTAYLLRQLRPIE